MNFWNMMPKTRKKLESLGFVVTDIEKLVNPNYDLSVNEPPYFIRGLVRRNGVIKKFLVSVNHEPITEDMMEVLFSELGFILLRSDFGLSEEEIKRMRDVLNGFPAEGENDNTTTPPD